MNLIHQAVQQGVKPDGAKPREMVHYTSEPVEGEKLSVLLKRGEPAKPMKP